MTRATSLRHSSEFERLAETIRATAGGEPVDFFASPGNWGDSLLNEGSRQFFDHFGITYHERRRADLHDDTISHTSMAVVGGGGGWNRNWSSTPDFTVEACQLYASVLVLPSTYDPALLAREGLDEVTLVSRARIDDDTIMFCHDMAFFLDPVDPGPPTVPFPLLAFRRDKERSRHAPNPDRNWDLSLLGTADHDAQQFLELVSRFPQVYTDRLHVAIAAGLMGREAFLFDGNYGKNAGVHSASILDNFPTVHLVHWDGNGQLDDVIGMKPIGIPGYED